MARTNNMNLRIVEEGITTLEDLTALINANMIIIDGHTHINSQGRPVPVSALIGDADLILNSNGVLNASFLNLNSSSVDSLINASLYFKDGELWVRDSAGNAVQVTSGGALIGQTASVDKTTSLLYGFGAVENDLDVTEGKAIAQAVNSFAVPGNRTAKTADFIKYGSYVEFNAPAGVGFYRIWVGILLTDLQTTTKFFQIADGNDDNQWVVASGSSAVGAANYRLFVRKVPLSENQQYGCLIKSWR